MNLSQHTHTEVKEGKEGWIDARKEGRPRCTGRTHIPENKGRKEGSSFRHAVLILSFSVELFSICW